MSMVQKHNATVKRRAALSIYSAFALSILTHALFISPIAVERWWPQPEEDSDVVLDLQGDISDSQQVAETRDETAAPPPPIEQDTTQEPPKETKDTSQAQAQSEAKPETVTDEGTQEQSPAQTQQTATPEPTPAPTPQVVTPSEAAGQNNTVGTSQNNQAAAAMKAEREEEYNRLKEYVKLLTKRLQAKLEEMGEIKKALARVSFHLELNGQIQPDSLKIAQSTGQPKLDASALKTVRESVPFDPPPREMNITIPFDFGRKR